MTVLMNGIYWAPEHARLMTTADLRKLLRKQGRQHSPYMPHRLLAIGDISCDLGVSREQEREEVCCSSDLFPKVDYLKRFTTSVLCSHFKGMVIIFI